MTAQGKHEKKTLCKRGTGKKALVRPMFFQESKVLGVLLRLSVCKQQKPTQASQEKKGKVRISKRDTSESHGNP